MDLLGVEPQGTRSAGGSCRLLRAADGWLAVNLARRADVELVAAWIGREWSGPVWDPVTAAVGAMGADDAAARAQLLGLPAAVAVPPPSANSVTTSAGRAGSVSRRLLDLSSLWAGPLCARLLGAAAGLEVTKLEDRHRPDGARAGPPAFWAQLNATKRDVQVDLASTDGRAELAALVRAADVVVTSARPRALGPLGLDPDTAAAAGTVWVAITGYGLTGPEQDRVAFGDDAAVAGGAAVAAGGPDAPVFVLDAVADPLAGLAGAAAALDALDAGRGAVVDVALRDVVAAALNPSNTLADERPEVRDGTTRPARR